MVNRQKPLSARKMNMQSPEPTDMLDILTKKDLKNFVAEVKGKKYIMMLIL